MKTRTILLWCLLGAVIATYLIVKLLVKDYNIGQIKTVDEMSEVQTTIIKGYDILKDYDANLETIRNHKTDFSIVGRNSAPIAFENREGLQAIIYNLTDYLKIEYSYEGTHYLIYSVNDYDTLERTVTSKKTYNKELLAKYLGVDESTLKSSVEKTRDLKDGEAYGKTVISSFENRKDKFENGTLYFILDGEEIFKLDVLKTKVKDYDIYKKEYETDSESNLLGYTFTKVLE